MKDKNVEMVIKAIDDGIREFADEEVYLIPFTASNPTSLFDNYSETYGTPIKAYAIVDYKINEADKGENMKKEFDETVVFFFSLKCFRDLSLVDENDLPIINDKWLIRNKKKDYKINKIDFDSPIKNKFLSFRFYCSLLRK